MVTEIPFRPLPLEPGDVRYLHGPDSTPQEGVPAGVVHEMRWDDSAVYPGTSRRLWVYVPASYDAADPPALLVLLDGDYFLDPTGEVRTAVVLDNLIHAGDLPPTLAVLVDPGVLAGAEPDGRGRNRQRNIEYDASADRYADFLLTEILPAVAARWPVTDDHDRWGIGGFSSGGSCALGVAWERPGAFRGVLGFSSSLAQLAGAAALPDRIALEPREPLRAFLQVGHRDLGWDEPQDNWFADTLRVAAALPRPATTYASSSATAATTPTTPASCCPTRCGGSSASGVRASVADHRVEDLHRLLGLGPLVRVVGVPARDHGHGRAQPRPRVQAGSATARRTRKTRLPSVVRRAQGPRLGARTGRGTSGR